MPLLDRIAQQLLNLPAALRALAEAQLAAGNEWIDLEIGRGEFAGRVALVMSHPFKAPPASLPEGVLYRELTDRDPMIYEYYTADEKWSLLTAKFKPMKFAPITGPEPPKPQRPPPEPNVVYEPQPMVAAIEKTIAKTDEATTAASGKKVAAPKTPAERFLASMTMTFDMWHDGLGYDLAALDEVPAGELPAIVRKLANQRPLDWRDVEALGRINLPAARAAVIEALKHPDPKVRREARRQAPEAIDDKEREAHLLESLKLDDIYAGLGAALDEVEEFHPPAVIDALFDGVLHRPGPTAVHFAARLFFIHGKSKMGFDWGHRPFFLKFHTTDPAEREVLFRELCAVVGVAPERYLK